MWWESSGDKEDEGSLINLVSRVFYSALPWLLSGMDFVVAICFFLPFGCFGADEMIGRAGAGRVRSSAYGQEPECARVPVQQVRQSQERVPERMSKELMAEQR